MHRHWQDFILAACQLCGRMALSTEAIIALLALFVACVPGVWFIVNHKNQICHWWSRTPGNPFPLLSASDHRQPSNSQADQNDAPHDWSRGHNQISLPTHSALHPSRNPNRQILSYLINPFRNSLKGHDIANQGISMLQLEIGLFSFNSVRHSTRIISRKTSL
jgi:hypothetical protein